MVAVGAEVVACIPTANPPMQIEDVVNVSFAKVNFPDLHFTSG